MGRKSPDLTEIRVQLKATTSVPNNSLTGNTRQLNNSLHRKVSREDICREKLEVFSRIEKCKCIYFDLINHFARILDPSRSLQGLAHPQAL